MTISCIVGPWLSSVEGLDSKSRQRTAALGSPGMNTDIRVAGCTNRPPAAVKESLEALRKAPLALVTSGLQPDEVAAHRAAFGGTVLVEPRPGLSRARNRALAWAMQEGAQVLAFVDDDAVADPGWWDAL